jgi:hypothetical protein
MKLKEIFDLAKSGNSEFNIEEDGVTYNLNICNNTITIVVRDEKKDFEKWLDTLDDDIFADASVIFSERTGKSLKDWDKIFTNSDAKEMMVEFVKIVKEVTKIKAEKIISDAITKANNLMKSFNK